MKPIDDSVDCCVIYHTNKHLSTEIADDPDSTSPKDTSFSTDVDDSIYYTGDHYSKEDNCTYYDSYCTNVYDIFNDDTNNNKTEVSYKPISVETKDPNYDK